MDQHYFLGDWGTTRLRLYRMAGEQIVDVRHGAGIGNVQLPVEVLRSLLEGWGNADRSIDADAVTLCGMASSRNGLLELSYAATPTDVESWARSSRTIQIETWQVLLATGVCCGNNDSGFDVMRGEEAQVFGAIRMHPALHDGRHLLVLPGTHSKWVDVVDGSITHIRTSLTGELYALLCDHSTLLKASSNPGSNNSSEDIHDAGFIAGAHRAMIANESLLHAMFKTRTAQLLQNRSADWAKGFLSGLLIGHEVAALMRETSPASVTLVGDPKITALYQRVFAMFAVMTDVLDGAACAIAGMQQLREVHHRLSRSVA